MIIPTSSRHLTNTVLMVRPYDFTYNAQTGVDNEFQNVPQDASQITQKALQEFDHMVNLLQAEGIEVLVPPKANDGKTTPDAVFPNNWISTEHDGTVVLYPMAAENRRYEKRIADIEALFNTHQLYIKNIVNIGRMNETEYFLEGTGSMIIDHNTRTVYAALSQRCHPTQLDNFLRVRNYTKGILFKTQSSKGKPIYHTNVMLSIGEAFAVVCSACIPDDLERNYVLQHLQQAHEIIDISLEQMEKHMCGNILQLRNKNGIPVIVMSQNAYEGFTPAQRSRLSQHGKLLPVPLHTIETVGGGSARCMLAEVFLPKVAKI
jgi:hypothetical protein